MSINNPFPNKEIPSVTDEDLNKEYDWHSRLYKEEGFSEIISPEVLRKAMILQKIAENNYKQAMQLVECCSLFEEVYFGEEPCGGFCWMVLKANGDLQSALYDMAGQCYVWNDVRTDIEGTRF
jgi:hypothetical protein